MVFQYNFFFIRSASPKDYIIQLPIPPENIEVSSGMETETVNIVNLGEVNILKGRKLKELSFSASLPRHSYLTPIRTRGEFSSPEEYIKLFESAQANNDPLILAVTGLGLNMKASVESFEYTYLTDYVDFSLSLKEYKDFKAKEVVLVTVTPDVPEEKPKPSVQTTPTNRTKTDFAIGDKVICTGTYRETSYATGASGTFKTGFVGKISHIIAKPNSGQTHTIHIVTDGGSHSPSQRITWIGWVRKDQLKHV